MDVSDFKPHLRNYLQLFTYPGHHINGSESFGNQPQHHLRKYNGILKVTFKLFVKKGEERVQDQPVCSLTNQPPKSTLDPTLKSNPYNLSRPAPKINIWLIRGMALIVFFKKFLGGFERLY